MQTILQWLTGAVGGPPALAIAAALLWGVASVVLSPCHLASIPLIVAYIHGQGEMSTRRALGMSSMFAAGILVTIAVIGILTAMAGRMLGSTGPVGTYVVAALLLLVGLHLVGVIPMSWTTPGTIRWQRKGYLAAAVLGLVFGIALGPCTFAYMAAVLGVVFKMAADRPFYAASLLGAYGVGHCVVIAAAGGSMGAVQKYLNWTEGSRISGIVKVACGILITFAGLWLFHIA